MKYSWFTNVLIFSKRIVLNYRYFLLCVNYFFYGETVADYFATFVQREEQLQFLIRYHRFISFALYLAGKLRKIFCVDMQLVYITCLFMLFKFTASFVCYILIQLLFLKVSCIKLFLSSRSQTAVIPRGFQRGNNEWQLEVRS